MAQTFAVVNDQTGEAKDCTLKDFAELQGQGYRIVDVGGYHAAMAEDASPVEEAKSAAAEQGNADAAAMAAEQYPDAKPDAADRPDRKSSEDGAQKDNDAEDRAAEQQRRRGR